MTEGITSPRAEPRVDGMKLLHDLTALDRAMTRIEAVTRLLVTEHGSHKASKETSAVLDSWSMANGLLTEAVAALEQARKPVMAIAVEAVTIICIAGDRAGAEAEDRERRRT